MTLQIEIQDFKSHSTEETLCIDETFQSIRSFSKETKFSDVEGVGKVCH